MDLKQIERLMSVMERARMKRIVIKREGFELELERESEVKNALPYREVSGIYEEKPSLKTYQPVASSPESDLSFYVTSPMVGTFYSSPSPEDPPYIKVGDSIEEDTVVCIVEAMKVMNEVKAQRKGKIVEILLKNGDPVEFGTKIFRVQS